jgi:hypothetical protein
MGRSGNSASSTDMMKGFIRDGGWRHFKRELIAGSLVAAIAFVFVLGQNLDSASLFQYVDADELSPILVDAELNVSSCMGVLKVLYSRV